VPEVGLLDDIMPFGLKNCGPSGSVDVCDGELEVEVPSGFVVGLLKNCGPSGSVDVCDGELEVEVPFGFVVGEPKNTDCPAVPEELIPVDPPKLGNALTLDDPLEDPAEPAPDVP
jgi:hypothetical protein